VWPRAFAVVASLPTPEAGSDRFGPSAISQSRVGRREAPIRPSIDRVRVRVRVRARARVRVRVRVRVWPCTFAVIASLLALEAGSHHSEPNAISQSRVGRREAPIRPITETHLYSDLFKVTPIELKLHTT
jgi:hypothetical protein